MSDNLLIQSTISFSAALLMGVTAGMGQCSDVCAPFLSAYIMGSGDGFLNGFKSFMIFTVGKVFMCAVLGLVTGYIGTELIGAGSYSADLSSVLGAIMVLIGFLMVIRPVSARCRKPKEEDEDSDCFSRHFTCNSAIHLFIMGMTFATIPCPPMGAMLLYGMQVQSLRAVS